MTPVRSSSLVALGLSAVMALSYGCVRRTIVRDRSAANDTRPSDIHIHDKKEDGQAHAQPPAKDPTVVVVQPTAPAPPPPVETRPPMPGTEYVWVDGRYEWRNSRWEWNPGYWQRRS